MPDDTPRICARCRWWWDYSQLYDDPDEPTDYGECVRDGGDEPMPDDGGCEHWELHPDLTGG